MITAIDLSKLRNAEFLQFGSLFSGLVVANDPAALNIAAQHEAFKSRLEETSALFKLERISPITQELVQLDDRRDKAINGLTAVINGYCNHFDVAVCQAASLLNGNLFLYGVGVARLNTQAETSTLNGIISDWEGKPELKAALTALNLTGWLTELKTANQLFQQKYIQRTQEYGAANPDTLKAKREETLAAYYELRKFIEGNSVVHPSATYEKLINELNALIDQYNGLIKSRPADSPPEPAPAPAPI